MSRSDPKEISCDNIPADGKKCPYLAIGAYKAKPGDLPINLCAGCRDWFKGQGVDLTKTRNHLKRRR